MVTCDTCPPAPPAPPSAPAARVYVAGPFTHGDQTANVRRALATADRLRDQGLVPVIPHLLATCDLVKPRPYEFWMQECISHLLTCNVVARMPGYSPGADREIEVATAAGIPWLWAGDFGA